MRQVRPIVKLNCRSTFDRRDKKTFLVQTPFLSSDLFLQIWKERGSEERAPALEILLSTREIVHFISFDDEVSLVSVYPTGTKPKIDGFKIPWNHSCIQYLKGLELVLDYRVTSRQY